MRSALFSLFLCVFAIGLSQQDKPEGSARRSNSGKQLREIRELGDYIEKGAQTGKTPFELATEFTSNNPDNSLAGWIKYLNPTICDEGASEKVKVALETIKSWENKWQIQKQADYFRRVVSDYNSRVESVCQAEEQKKLADESEERELKRLEREQLKSETAKIERLKNSEFGKRKRQELKRLAAVSDGLPEGCYDLSGIRAASEARKELAGIELIASDEVKRLRTILDRYLQEVFRRCLDGYGHDGQGTIADLARFLISNLSAMSGEHSQKNDGLASLKAADKAIAEARNNFLSKRHANDFIEVLWYYKNQILDVQLERYSKKWAANYLRLKLKLGEKGISSIGMLTSIIRELSSGSPREDISSFSAANWLRKPENVRYSLVIPKLKVAKYYKPCEDLVRHEEFVGALEPFYALSEHFSHIDIYSATGELGGEKSKLVVWVGRWRVCKWFVSHFQRPKP